MPELSRQAVSADIKTIIPQIISIEAEPFDTDRVISSAEKLILTLSLLLAGISLNGAESRSISRLAPVTEINRHKAAPDTPGQISAAVPAMNAGPGAMQHRRRDPACRLSILSCSASADIRVAPTGYPASWLMIKTGKSSSGSLNMYRDNAPKGSPASLYISDEISSDEITVKAKRDGIITFRHTLTEDDTAADTLSDE
ncbi:MAG: hypothetical protein ACI4KF_11950 [Huintestinicola sp.]